MDFDLELVDPQDQPKIIQLSEICSITLAQAFQILCESSGNLQAAINQQFGIADFTNRTREIYGGNREMSFSRHSDQLEVEEGDSRMRKYKRFMQSDISFPQKYGISQKNNQKGSQRIVNTIKMVERQSKKEMRAQWWCQSLEQALLFSWNNSFPLCMLVIEQKQSSQLIKKMINCDKLMKILTVQFKLIVADTGYPLKDNLSSVLKLSENRNFLLLVRINIYDQLQVFKRIQLTTDPQGIIAQIKKAKNQSMRSYLQQLHLVKQFHHKRRGDYNYRPPSDIKQKQHRRAQNRLRNEQTQQYFKAVMPMAGSKEEETKVKHQQKANIKSKAECLEEIRKQREQKRARMTIYKQGICFKIRVPQGRVLMLTVDKKERVEYLFHYIQSELGQMGFQNELDRKFDLMVGYGSSQFLAGDIFEDNATLLVKQLE